MQFYFADLEQQIINSPSKQGDGIHSKRKS